METEADAQAWGAAAGGDGGVRLKPWGEGDFWLLERTNSPEMTEHLGGPESAERLAERHRRYLGLSVPGQMFRVVAGGRTVGSIGFWQREWEGSTVYETGWGVLPEFQGRGLAARAARAVAAAARDDGRNRYLHAFPSTDHPASNAVCRRAGFTLLGPVRFEYPKGTWIASNDWRLDLRTQEQPEP
ncbi:GNAT family N-acetyltransferase [Actinacidiphila yeochonensis]|uniref:GNAT family N-acetyltransferase n=1 Tax=Actinacidiphila yeochonensis TaxID=89050 RepID=UPI00068D9938|nr:GNAT family N-acetyltransferase [Actinacidiphila yeochonensis]